MRERIFQKIYGHKDLESPKLNLVNLKWLSG